MIRLRALFLAGAILLAGCSDGSSPANTPSTATTAINSVPPPTATFTAYDTSTPTTTATPTPLPPTWTPLPTLSSEDAQARVIELLKDNAGCELPCWWGIVPGETSWQSAQQFLTSLAGRVGQGVSSISIKNGIEYSYLNYAVRYKVTGYPEDIASGYRVSNGIIDMIVVSETGTELSYQIFQMFDLYGPPQEVLINVMPDSNIGKPWLWLALFYPQRGIMAFYDGAAKLYEGKVQICSQGLGPRLTLLPIGEMTLDEMKRSLLDLNVRAIMKPVNEAMGMEIEDFYNEMKSPDSCYPIDSSQVK
jgi:hypothetical protein